jgi:predicted RNA binding protein YcfA (HicA-like mRNA interferase family)
MPRILHARYNSEMKVKVVVKRLKDDGWVLVRRKGSHRQFKHPARIGLVTVPGKQSDELAPGTVSSIFKQAGWK